MNGRFFLDFLLFVLPFIVFPFGHSPFEIPKVFLAEIAILAIVFIHGFLPGHPADRVRSMKKPRPIKSTILLLGGLTLLHLALYGSMPLFWGNIYRLQGIFLLWCLVALSVGSQTIEVRTHLRSLPFWSLTVLVIFAWIFGTNEEGRSIGTLGEPNALAAAAIFLWPLAVVGVGKWKYHMLFWAGIGGEVVMLLFMTGSRSAALAFGFQLFLVGFSRLRIPRFLGLLFVCVGLGLSMILPFFQQSGPLESRTDVWQTAWHAGLAHPILGGGFGNIQTRLSESAWKLTNTLRFQVVDSSHNIFLDWWVQGGIVGVGILMFFLFTAFRNFVKRGMMLETVLLVGLLSVMSFNPVSVVTLVQFWWVVGRGAIWKNDEIEE